MSPLTTKRLFFYFILLNLVLCSCSIQKKLSRSAKADVLDTKALQNAHVGISIYEPATGKYWFNFQGDKYFVPASNTKIPTCYAAMKYLGDSLVGLRYAFPDKSNKVLVIKPAGDPSFLHPDYKRQPVADFLDKYLKSDMEMGYAYGNWNDRQWGSGWSWNDYDETYMAERSPFPIYGNVITIRAKDLRTSKSPIWEETDLSFTTGAGYFDSLVKEGYRRYLKLEYKDSIPGFSVTRSMTDNTFDLKKGERPFSSQEIPFSTGEEKTVLQVLREKYKKGFSTVFESPMGKYHIISPVSGFAPLTISKWNVLHSQPTDSLLKPMMHRSDNFFAEQSLLMVSNELLGVMNDQQVIDTLLKTDFSDLPQKPKWVDGSGLSRYNLFTPQDFVAIFDKMAKNFGMERIKNIFPTGGTGTISSYYKAEQGYIFVKTGTLSGVVALSGFLLTKKNKQLIFSVLVNNHTASSTDVRRAVEKFLEELRNNY